MGLDGLDPTQKANPPRAPCGGENEKNKKWSYKVKVCKEPQGKEFPNL